MDRFAAAFRAELAAFTEVIAGQLPSPCTLADALEASWITPAACIAAAPISWGVCEVPGWGYQLSPQRVLAEMRDVGVTATELGPDGFLPAAPDARPRCWLITS